VTAALHEGQAAAPGSHGESRDLVAGLDEEGRGDGGIDAAGKADGDSACIVHGIGLQGSRLEPVPGFEGAFRGRGSDGVFVRPGGTLHRMRCSM